MRLIKENSTLLWRFFVNHIGMMILGCLLSTVGAAYDNIFLFMAIFNIIFYMSLLYIAGWDQGAKDVIRAEGGRIPRRPWLGFVIAAAASFVTVLLLILLFVGYLFGYGVADSDFGMGLFGIIRIVIGYWQSPYLGIVNFFMPTAIVDGTVTYAVLGMTVARSTYFLILNLFYFITLIPGVLAGGIGYLFGYKNLRIFGSHQKSDSKKKA